MQIGASQCVHSFEKSVRVLGSTSGMLSERSASVEDQRHRVAGAVRKLGKSRMFFARTDRMLQFLQSTRNAAGAKVRHGYIDVVLDGYGVLLDRAAIGHAASSTVADRPILHRRIRRARMAA